MEKKCGVAYIADDKLRVATPLGTLIVYASNDPEYPGIYIDLRRDGFDVDMPVALVETTETEADQADGVFLISRAWGDATSDEYTDRVVHKNIERFF